VRLHTSRTSTTVALAAWCSSAFDSLVRLAVISGANLFIVVVASSFGESFGGAQGTRRHLIDLAIAHRDASLRDGAAKTL